MEDTSLVRLVKSTAHAPCDYIPNVEHAFFGVFDGHGGSQVPTRRHAGGQLDA